MKGDYRQNYYKDSKIIVYVDGSYNESTGIYSYGCVFLPEDGTIRTICGNGNDPENAKQRNVTGEMLGAMRAVLCAIKSGYKAIEIHYDYQGIEAWPTRAWKAKNPLTKAYAEFMQNQMYNIKISFSKVKAHSGDKYNNIADKMAKAGGLTKNSQNTDYICDMEIYYD